MAQQIMVFGPTLISWMGSVVGQSDGNQLIVIEEVAPHYPVTTDAQGGQPEDFVQLGKHAIVVLPLVKYDDALCDRILSAILKTSTVGTPGSQPGDNGDVGTLRIGDPGYGTLVVAGSKSSSAKGGYSYSFTRAFRDPDINDVLNAIGCRPSMRMLTMRALPDNTGKIYTRSAVA